MDGFDGAFHAADTDEVSLFKRFVEDDHDKAVTMLRNMHYSNSVIKAVSLLLSNVDAPVDTDYQLKKLLSEIGLNASYDVMSLKIAMNRIIDYTCIRKKLKQFNENLIKRNELAVNGDDLISIGYKGKDIGKILDELYDMILQNELPNDHQILIEYAKKRK